MEKIRILQVVPNMHAAGLETLIMNIYRNIDRTKIQFDFLVHYKERHFYDEEIEKLGGKIYRLSFRNDGNIVKYLKDLDNFFENNKYDIVHGHMASTACFYLGMAKKHNVPIRILHSHNTSTEKNLKGFIKYQLLKLSTIFANNYFACGKLAGEFLYRNKSFKVIHNAIDLNVFKPDGVARNDLREKYNIGNKFVLAHIGRFNSQKNHMFMLNVFNKFHKIVPESLLVLVGDGETKNDVYNRVNELGLNESVLFLGVRRDINSIYNMSDIFLLPSLFEGLPVVGVECQAAGKQAFFSDTITNEIKITKLIEFLPIDKENSADIWCNKLIERMKNTIEISEEEIKSNLGNSGYDIRKEAINLQNLYFELLKSKKE
ncbi:glycosyltransferase family 1 protein [Clostridium perfringens]|nr:glycosyltransferase family 1 protein [Clostridium perfringens]